MRATHCETRQIARISALARRLLLRSASAVCLWHDATVLGSQIVGSRGCAILRGLCPFIPSSWPRLAWRIGDTRLDLNADLGEHDGAPPEPARALLRIVTSASIACGWHAGDAVSMRLTIAEAAALGVQIGAHPSYPDREGFGRRAMPMTPAEITDAVAHQVHALCAVAAAERTSVRHVKPHGALYNLACRDRRTADAITAGIVLVDARLALYAPSGSVLAEAGRAARLHVVAEGFLDRAYEDDGGLTPREVPGAVLHDAEAACERAIAWAETGPGADPHRSDAHLPLWTRSASTAIRRMR